ncbi:MAG: hypothetical protein IT443_01025 [Phycisphaeraceae bacterium]|nr:hypothetical protein [Phycisphaeraceae bacterium]
METRYLSPSSNSIDWNVLVGQPLKELLIQIIGFIPSLVTALGILLIGWLVSKLVMFLVKSFLDAIRGDKIAESAGIAQMLKDAGVGLTPCEWVSRFFFWVGIFITWITAFQALSLHVIARSADQIVYYLGAVAMAFVTLVLGLLVSLLIGRLVETTARNLKAPNPGLQAGIMKWAVVVFTFILVLNLLAFPSEFILILFAIVFVALGITFVIAFGFGGREWAKKVLERVF